MSLSDTRIPTLLVSAASTDVRETWIVQDLHARPVQHAALLLEGLPSGRSPLDDMPQLSIRRSAPGCLCCTGNLVLRVGLNRLLRERPERLYISVAAGTHLDVLSNMLTAAPYDAWLTLTQNISL